MKLNALTLESGHPGQNWDSTKGGYQTLTTAPFVNFGDDKSTASWFANAASAGRGDQVVSLEIVNIDTR